MDLIDKNAAIDAVLLGLTYVKAFDKVTGEVKEPFSQGNYELMKAVDRIKELPSTDAVEVKHGRWQKTEESPMRPYMCSQCGSLFDLDTLLGIPTWRWCPKCGAIMEVDDE